MEEVTVTLRGESADRYLNENVLAVSRDVVGACGQIIAADPALGVKPFVIQQAPDGQPRACLNGLPVEYIVNVTCLHTESYPQLAFQIGHELSHFYINPNYSNWFIESVCTAISFLCLDALVEKWRTAPLFPLFPNWQDFFLSFTKYREANIIDPLKKFCIENRNDIPAWIRASVVDLIRARSLGRDEQTLCADVIADIMQLHAQSCSVVTKLGAASQSGKTDFNAWRKAASSEERELVDDLNSLFGHIS